VRGFQWCVGLPAGVVGGEGTWGGGGSRLARVVGLPTRRALCRSSSPQRWGHALPRTLPMPCSMLYPIYFEKIRVFKTRKCLKRRRGNAHVVDGIAFNLLNSSAWDNRTRPWLFLILLALRCCASRRETLSRRFVL
jgi:hypothetical protein